MKISILIPLAILGFSAAMASGPVLTCPEGSQLVSVLGTNPMCDSPSSGVSLVRNFCTTSAAMASEITTAKPGSLYFKGAVIKQYQGKNIVRCAYSSSNGAVDAALNPILANAVFEPSVGAEPGSNTTCFVPDNPSACKFSTKN